MLMNHKNFHFTQIPDKTNEVIFLKSPKTIFGPFLTIFGHFCSKIRLSHTTICEPLTPCQVSEKTNEPIPRKLMDRRKDGRKDRPYFIGPFRPRLGVQQNTFYLLTMLRFLVIHIYMTKMYAQKNIYKLAYNMMEAVFTDTSRLMKPPFSQ